MPRVLLIDLISFVVRPLRVFDLQGFSVLAASSPVAGPSAGTVREGRRRGWKVKWSIICEEVC